VCFGKKGAGVQGKIFFTGSFLNLPQKLFIINLFFCPPHIQAYMFKYDSTHGVFSGTIKVLDDSNLEINGKQIKITSKRYCFWGFIFALISVQDLKYVLAYCNLFLSILNQLST